MKKVNILIAIAIIITSTIVKAQDTIVLLSKEKIVAKIITVTSEDVTYKPFESQDGPDKVEMKTNIKKIKYKNGIIENIDPKSIRPKNKEANINGSPTFNVKTSTQLFDNSRWVLKDVFGKDNKNVFVFNMGQKNSELEAVDAKTMTSVYKINIDIPYFNAHEKEVAPPRPFELFTNHRMFYHDGKIVYLSSWYDKSKNENNVFGATYSAADGSNVVKKTTLLNDPLDKHRERVNKRKAESFGIVKDEFDMRTGCVSYSFYPSLNGNNIVIISHWESENTFTFKVLDFDLKVVAEGGVEAPELIAQMGDFIWDDNGSLYYSVGRITDSIISGGTRSLGFNFRNAYVDVTEKTDLGTINLRIVKINTQTKSNRIIDVGQTDKIISCYKLKLFNDKIIVGGYYASGADGAGSFVNILEKESGKISTHSEGLINFGLPHQGLQSYIQDIIISKNGIGYIAAEHKRIELITEHSTNSTAKTHHVKMFYGSIILTCFDNKGDIKWNKKVDKSETLTFDEGYASYGCWLSGDELNLAHDDLKQPSIPFMPMIANGIFITNYKPTGEKLEEKIGMDEGNKLIGKNAFSFSEGNTLYTTGTKSGSEVLIQISKD